MIKLKLIIKENDFHGNKSYINSRPVHPKHFFFSIMKFAFDVSMGSERIMFWKCIQEYSLDQPILFYFNIWVNKITGSVTILRNAPNKQAWQTKLFCYKNHWICQGILILSVNENRFIFLYERVSVWVANHSTLEFMGIIDFYICFIFVRNVCILSNLGALSTAYYTKLTVTTWLD